jgi:hypothetical protein
MPGRGQLAPPSQDHQLAGEISKRRHVLLRMLEYGQVAVDACHLPLAALASHFRRDQGGAFPSAPQIMERDQEL